MIPDIADIIAGELKVSRATAYDLMREALKRTEQTADEPAFHGFMDKEQCCVNICYTPWAPGGPNNELPTAYYTTPPAAQTVTCNGMPAYEGSLSAAQTAPVQEPVAIYQYQLASGSWIDQTKESYDYNVRHGQATVRIVYTTPPAAQPAVPLTDEQIYKAAMKLAECMDYPWAQMPEQGKQSMRNHAKAVIEAAAPEKVGAA